MDTIDKNSLAYIEAVEAETEAMEQELIDPPDISAGGTINAPKRRQKTDEIKYFLKTNTLSVLERLHNMAMDTLYTRDDQGVRIRQPVTPGVQLQAAMNFLDRSMGKPQINVDVTSEGRPICVDPALLATPLIQTESTYEIEKPKDS